MTIDSVSQNLIIFIILLETDEVSVKIHCSDRRRSTSHAIIENQISLVRIGLYEVLYQFNWFLCRMMIIIRTIMDIREFKHRLRIEQSTISLMNVAFFFSSLTKCTASTVCCRVLDFSPSEYTISSHLWIERRKRTIKHKNVLRPIHEHFLRVHHVCRTSFQPRQFLTIILQIGHYQLGCERLCREQYERRVLFCYTVIFFP